MAQGRKKTKQRKEQLRDRNNNKAKKRRKLARNKDAVSHSTLEKQRKIKNPFMKLPERKIRQKRAANGSIRKSVLKRQKRDTNIDKRKFLKKITTKRAHASNRTKKKKEFNQNVPTLKLQIRRKKKKPIILIEAG